MSRWFVLGAVGLSGVAGFTNSATVNLGSLAASHLTGSITRVSVEFAQRDYSNMLPFAVILGSFFAGAVLSGAVIGDRELGAGRRYSVMLLLEAGLFAVAAFLAAERDSMAGIGVAAFACGLQNALASSFHGMVVRTTHMTGIVTDVGFQVGKFLVTGKRVEGQFSLQIGLIAGFAVGGVVGAVCTALVGSQALLVSSAAVALGAVIYETLQRRSLA